MKELTCRGLQFGLLVTRSRLSSPQHNQSHWSTPRDGLWLCQRPAETQPELLPDGQAQPAALPSRLPGWDQWPDWFRHGAEACPLWRRSVPSLACFLPSNERTDAPCSEWLAHSPACQARVRFPWPQLGPARALFFSRSHRSVRAAPLFSFKSPLHQLLGGGDISGKCEEMAAEPKP